MKRFYKLGMVICIVAFVSAAGYLANYYLKSRNSIKQSEKVRQEAYIDSLQEEDWLIEGTEHIQEQIPSNENEHANKEAQQQENTSEEPSNTATESIKQKHDANQIEKSDTHANRASSKNIKITNKAVIDFKKLKKRNSEVAAWIHVNGTQIDYPVTYVKKNNVKYLTQNLDGKKDSHGTLFFEQGCIPGTSDSNLLIYGHNMKDGSMFSGLNAFQNKKKLEANPNLFLFTPDINYLYRAVGAVVTDVDKDNEDAFFFSDYIDLTDHSIFKEFKKQIETHQLYEPLEPIEEDASYLMLATCEYSTEQGRLVVIYKRVDEAKIKQ